MKTFIASRRAGLGLAGLLALLLYYFLHVESGDSWGDLTLSALNVLMIGLAILGGYALATSPYVNILYRSVRPGRATSAAARLDERELALRDRAAGLTYYLFAALNLLLFVGAAIAWEIGLITLEADMLLKAAIPYAYLALSLPVLMLEWSKPSQFHVHPELEEED